jgi:hypothetical protein
MIFQIEYNRKKGILVTLQEFESSQRREALTSRLELELELNNQGIDHEVVLLEAENMDALQRTHRRYFADLHHLLISSKLQSMEEKMGQEGDSVKNSFLINEIR